MMSLVCLLASAAQQEVTPPPGPEVLAEARSKEQRLAQTQPVDLRGSGPWTLSNGDGTVELELHGTIDMDWGFFDAENGLESTVGDFGNGAELRRARLGVVGRSGEFVKFKLSTELTDSAVRDAYVDLVNFLPVGTLRIGHFREPMGLSNMTPSRNQTFLERPLASALFPGRNLGFAWSRGFDEDRGAWTIGLFRAADRNGLSEDGTGGNELALTSRLTWLAHEANSGQELLHIGSSFSWRNPDDGQVQFDGDADTRLGPNLLDTGTILAEEVYLLGLEAAWIDGPSSVLFEYNYAGFDRPGGVNPGLKGWSFEASHIVTGESRGYQRGRAALWDVEPTHPFEPGGSGWGAFEFGFRASRLDLQDEGVPGGDGLNMAVAWNWYLSKDLRFQTNFVRADREAAGDVHALLMRFHFRF